MNRESASRHRFHCPFGSIERNEDETAPIIRRPVMAFALRCRRQAAAFLLLLLSVMPGRAGMQEVLEAIQASKFRFARTQSEVPFMPLGWLQDRYYPNSTFRPEEGDLAEAIAAENTLGLGAVLPAYVAERDMLMLGADFSLDHIAVKSGPYQDQRVLTLTPVAAWLHQFGSDDLVGAFVAPMFSYELRAANDWGFSGYGGLVGMHYFSDELQLLYGGVYQNSFGDSMGFPYLGVNWLPAPRWSVALVIPWPTLTYAVSDRWLVQLAVAPGGSSWVQRDTHVESTQSLSSWNLTLGAGYRLHENLWLSGSVGVAGLRGLTITQGDREDRLESRPGAVFSLALQFRP